jgi:hypothetical protein
MPSRKEIKILAHQPAPCPADETPPDVMRDILALLQLVTEKVNSMALDFTSFDADLTSLKQEVAAVATALAAAKQTAADKAADEAALAQRDADIKALRDQLAALTAPAA